MISLSLLAYLVADLAHHLLGHGAACILAHGKILLLSSIVLKCSAHSALIDVSGPIGNLLAGLCALILTRAKLVPAFRMFVALTVGFNLFWLGGHLVQSVVTRSDDWAWLLLKYHIVGVPRYLLIATGVAVYLGTVRALAALTADFGLPEQRIRRICAFAWLAAAALATVTALFDTAPGAAMLKHALPQGLLSPIGLLWVARRAARGAAPAAAEPLERDPSVIAAGIVGTCLSVALLGRGIPIGFYMPHP